MLESNQSLVGYLTSKLDEWEEYRDNNYKSKWEEYYRLWRGIWQEDDKTRSTERSRLINPALQQAIESTTAEMEEAVFGKGHWFDLSDDLMDEEKQDAMLVRGLLREDHEVARTKEGLCELIFNGTLYGTGIGELTMEPMTEGVLVEVPQVGTIGVTSREFVSKDSMMVKLRSVSPDRFLIDPVATSIEEAFGCGVVDYVSIHKIKQGIKRGFYKDVDVGDTSDKEDVFAKGEQSYRTAGKVKLVTYYGLVPYGMLKEDNPEYEELFPKGEDDTEAVEEDDDELVEAIVILANDSVVLKAVESPYFGKDRPLVAYQHEKVPNRFWGRGVAEKGYNPQKALDAELRARIDALALSTHPMMGVDASRLPRGMKFEVAPGKSILTNGNPAEVLMPLNFNTVAQSSFVQSNDLERQVQVATGAMDTAAPLSMNARNATSSGMSMMQGGAIKRAKRTLMTFQEKIIVPLVNKSLWRYIQFRPDRYPATDYKFIPVGTMGIMAREYEQQLLIQLMSMTPPDSAVYPMIVSSIIDNSSIANRESLIAQMKKAQEPNPQEEAMKQQAFQAQQDKLKAETDYLNNQIEGIKVKAQMDAIKLASDKLESKGNDPKIELEKSIAQADAVEKQQRLELDRQKAVWDYDIELRKLKQAEDMEDDKEELLGIPEDVGETEDSYEMLDTQPETSMEDMGENNAD